MSNHDISYEAWMEQVDAAVLKFAGVSVHDLADFQFRDAFSDGESPKSVARQVLAAEGWGE